MTITLKAEVKNDILKGLITALYLEISFGFISEVSNMTKKTGGKKSFILIPVSHVLTSNFFLWALSKLSVSKTAAFWSEHISTVPAQGTNARLDWAPESRVNSSFFSYLSQPTPAEFLGLAGQSVLFQEAGVV